MNDFPGELGIFEPISQEGMDILRKAVDLIVDGERQSHPGQSEAFWAQFRDVLLAMVIERRGELLSMGE